MLVVYLALELDAKGFAISGILAAPRLAGVLRLGVPALIARLAPSGFGRKGICLTAYLLSSITLVLVPFAAIGAGQFDQDWGIGALIGAWSLYHLLEYTGTVSLWSWLGDLYPARGRSIILGHRERWLVMGRLVGLGISFALASLWILLMPDEEQWIPLAASASLGAILLTIAVIPLVFLPALASHQSAAPQTPWRTILKAFTERPYRRLMTYSCWFGIANGITSTVQSLYTGKVLGISYPTMLCIQSGMRGGQSAIAPWCGRMIAKHGAKRVMLPAQLLVSTGPLFFWLSTPEAIWWIVGAYLVWIAYAGINVGLDTLKLNLADPKNNGPYVALYHSMSDLANAVTTLLGGWVYDVVNRDGVNTMTFYATLFLLGWFARSLSVIWIARLDENRLEQDRCETPG